MKYKNIILIIIVIINIISGCIIKDDNQENIICYYNYNIKVFSNISFNLYLPIPVYSDENRNIIKSSIINNLGIIEGKNITFTVNNTIFGISINVKGYGSVELGVIGSDLNIFNENGNYNMLFLSLVEDKDNDGYYDDEYGDLSYFINSNNSNIKIIMEFNYIYQDRNGLSIYSYTTINGILKKDWNNINGTFITVIT